VGIRGDGIKQCNLLIDKTFAILIATSGLAIVEGLEVVKLYPGTFIFGPPWRATRVVSKESHEYEHVEPTLRYRNLSDI
jgi:hypothetical protein